MEISPEERRKIYEEEKARIEAEQRQKADSGKATTGLKPNVAGLLCYVGFWITGIIFIIIEQRNKFVRFHAVQSIIVFGVLAVASGVFGWMPFVGGFFRTVIGIIAFISWIVLMVKAYRGELYKVPVVGDIAGSIIPISDIEAGEIWQETEEVKAPKAPAPPEAAAPPIAPTPPITDRVKRVGHRIDEFFTGTRAGRITSSSFTIAWSIILLVFFSFFSGYIAYYQPETAEGITTWTRHSFLTSDYYLWLPILITTLALSVAGHILLIIYDRYWLRQIVLIGLNIMGVVTLGMLVYIFPFNFSVIPGETVADIVSVSVTIALIAIAVGLGISTLVMFIKLIINLARAA
ncbi:DUF4870 domain-containing protein [Chloroflexota bacterium]